MKGCLQLRICFQQLFRVNWLNANLRILTWKFVAYERGVGPEYDTTATPLWEADRTLTSTSQFLDAMVCVRRLILQKFALTAWVPLTKASALPMIISKTPTIWLNAKDRIVQNYFTSFFTSLVKYTLLPTLWLISPLLFTSFCPADLIVIRDFLAPGAVTFNQITFFPLWNVPYDFKVLNRYTVATHNQPSVCFWRRGLAQLVPLNQDDGGIASRGHWPRDWPWRLIPWNLYLWSSCYINNITSFECGRQRFLPYF